MRSGACGEVQSPMTKQFFRLAGNKLCVYNGLKGSESGVELVRTRRRKDP